MGLVTWFAGTAITVLIYLFSPPYSFKLNYPPYDLARTWLLVFYCVVSLGVAESAARATSRMTRRGQQVSLVAVKLFGLSIAAAGSCLTLFAYFIRRSHYDLELGWLAVFVLSVGLMILSAIFLIIQVGRIFTGRKSGFPPDVADWLLVLLSILGAVGPLLSWPNF